MMRRQGLPKARTALIPVVLSMGLSIFGVAELDAQFPEMGAQYAEPYRPAVLSVYPFLGVSTAPPEVDLPVAGMAGLRISLELWMRFNRNVKVAIFVAGRGGVLGVNEQRVCQPVACTGTTDYNFTYMGTGDAGFILGVPGRPYAFAYFGRAYPVEAYQGYDPSNGTWNPASPNTWGLGGGFTVPLGRLSVQLEGRFRRDGRYLANVNDSMEFVLGFPFGTG